MPADCDFLKEEAASFRILAASKKTVAAAMRIAGHVMIMNRSAIVFEGLPDEARGAIVWN